MKLLRLLLLLSPHIANIISRHSSHSLRMPDFANIINLYTTVARKFFTNPIRDIAPQQKQPTEPPQCVCVPTTTRLGYTTGNNEVISGISVDDDGGSRSSGRMRGLFLFAHSSCIFHICHASGCTLWVLLLLLLLHSSHTLGRLTMTGYPYKQ